MKRARKRKRSTKITISPIVMVCYWCRARPGVMCRFKGVTCDDYHSVRRDDAATAEWMLVGRLPTPRPKIITRKTGWCRWR